MKNNSPFAVNKTSPLASVLSLSQVRILHEVGIKYLRPFNPVTFVKRTDFALLVVVNKGNVVPAERMNKQNDFPSKLGEKGEKKEGKEGKIKKRAVIIVVESV